MRVDKGYTVAVNPADFEIEEPTRRCLVCECKEDPGALTVYNDKAWLCPECKAALQTLVEVRRDCCKPILDNVKVIKLGGNENGEH